MAKGPSLEGGATPEEIDRIFRPRSVAVVGVSSRASAPGLPGGYSFLRAIQGMGFAGPLYPVNPKSEEVAGLRCHPNLRAIPGPVDHVIASVPAAAIPPLVDDCIAVGARSLHMFTAGFRETGETERAQLEAEVLRRARAGGLRLIGPNCMGLYDPLHGLSFMPGFPREPGPVGLISQSGANAGEFIYSGDPRGLRFSHAVSYGNALDLNECDFLEYLAQDERTEIIAIYLEGVRQGRRFARLLRDVAPRKPVAILKGGRTEAGGRAATSHTASLAGSLALFRALCRQAGAVLVESLDELVDIAVAFRFLAPPSGRGVAMIAAGGGHSVLSADDLASVGLEVPPLPPETQSEILSFTPIAGSSVRNPIDSTVFWLGPQEIQKAVDTVRLAAAPEEVHTVLFTTGADWNPRRRGQPQEENLEQTVETLVRAREGLPKPVVVVLRQPTSPGGAELTFQLGEMLWRKGFATFPSVARAARAIASMLARQEGLKDLPPPGR